MKLRVGIASLAGAVALLMAPVAASADVSFTRASGWGVSDGTSQFETCTSPCAPGIAGGGAGQLNLPALMATDGSGNAYLADSGNNRIDEFSSTGGFTKAWGWGVSDGMSQFEICTSSCRAGLSGGGAGQLHLPVGVAIDSSGDVYVADTQNYRIDEFSSTGDFSKAWGWGVADGMSHFETCTNTCQAGLPGGGAGEFNQPFGVATDSSGDVYVGDSSNNRIDEFSSTGGFTKAWGWGVSDGMSQFETCSSSCQFGLYGGGAGQLASSEGVATDGSGNLYVADRGNQRIDEFSQTGAFTRAWGWGVSDGLSRLETCTSLCQGGLSGGGAGQLNTPYGVAIDSSGALYVVDSNNNRIDEFSSTGDFTKAWGWGVSDGMSQFETCTSTCQTGLSGGGAGQTNQPYGVARPSSGDVLVADTQNNRIDEFSVSPGGSGGSGACPGVQVKPTGQPPGSISDKLKQLLDRKYVLAQQIADVGPLDVVGYGEAKLADASLCVDNVLIQDLQPFATDLSFLKLLTKIPGQHSSERNFAFDAIKGWQYQSGSGDWSLTPAGQNFSLDWASAAIKPVFQLNWDDVKDKNIIKDDVAQATSPTLTTTLIDAPQLYLSAALQGQATFGVAFGPGQIKLECALEASVLPLPILNRNSLLPFQKAQQFQNALRDHFPDILNRFPALYGATDIAAGVAALPSLNYVGRACADGVVAKELVVPVVAVTVVGFVGAALEKIEGGRVAQLQTAAYRRVRIPASGPLKRLVVSSTRIRKAGGLHTAPVTAAEAPAFTRALELLPARASVSRLIVSTKRLRAGRRFLVLGARLPDRPPHRATIVVRGPGYSAAAAVGERHGIAGGLVHLPAHMHPGTWAIAIIDDSKLRPGPKHTIRGISEVRLGIFHVSKPHRRHHRPRPHKTHH